MPPSFFLCALLAIGRVEKKCVAKESSVNLIMKTVISNINGIMKGKEVFVVFELETGKRCAKNNFRS